MIAEYIYNLIADQVPAVIGGFPNTQRDVVAILEYDSEGLTDYFGGADQASLRYPIVKIVSRTESYEQGKQWMEILSSLLHKYTDNTLLSVLMVASPIYLGKGSTNLHEFQITFTITIKE